jgi:uncharacterized protein YbjT (DUF2867 family)
MSKGKKVLVAGGTGYLGRYVLHEFKSRGWFVRALARSPERLGELRGTLDETIKGEITDPTSIDGICKGMDVVFSSVGITRQKDGLTYMDVDYLGNLNLLREAQKCGVEKFIYVSVLNGEKMRHLKICNAKELFVEQLKNSGLDYSIIRPNGFFSDMADFYKMAKKGRVYLFGNGELKANPIHGEDLAAVCVASTEQPRQEINAGGPEILTQNEIAITAFNALGLEPKITHIPDWIRAVILKLVRTFTGSKTYGPVEFFLTVMAMDMVAPQNGKHTLRDFFSDLS